MTRIKEITQINRKHIALFDSSSVAFLQQLQTRGIELDSILKDYELILIPKWVLTEIRDSIGRSEYLQTLIDTGYPIYCVAEESYSELTGYEEGNLYRIVMASTSLIGSIRAYLRRYVERPDPLNMEVYENWIKRLYDEWPVPGDILSNGREKKKNAGEISITILAEVLSWYYPETELLTIYSQDSDTYNFQRKAEESLKKIFASRMPVPVSYKSNDVIFCQLFREGEIDADDIMECRKDKRKVTYSIEQSDHSTALVTKRVDNNSFIELIQDESVYIIF